jgi:Restriction endonuclease
VVRILGNGQRAAGRTDLVLRTPKAWVVFDHKSTPQGVAQWEEVAQKHAGQLAAYREVLQAVSGVLVALGYGGSRKDAAQVVGGGGDEGIDGIIKEDRLGLDIIYVQAKRWQSTVGRPEIQRFAGALQGQRARKGVFITTTSFSADAKAYAAGLQTTIVLIDGPMLAQLMMDSGIGVSEAETIRILKPDEYRLRRAVSEIVAEWRLKRWRAEPAGSASRGCCRSCSARSGSGWSSTSPRRPSSRSCNVGRATAGATARGWLTFSERFASCFPVPRHGRIRQLMPATRCGKHFNRGVDVAQQSWRGHEEAALR